MVSPVQYAKLPKFEYQTIQPQYQTFDRRTMKFAYYPVNSVASTFPLTSEKDQDENTNNNPVEVEEKKDDPASENQPAGEEPSGESPAESLGADGAGGGECSFLLSF